MNTASLLEQLDSLEHALNTVHASSLQNSPGEMLEEFGTKAKLLQAIKDRLDLLKGQVAQAKADEIEKTYEENEEVAVQDEAKEETVNASINAMLSVLFKLEQLKASGQLPLEMAQMEQLVKTKLARCFVIQDQLKTEEEEEETEDLYDLVLKETASFLSENEDDLYFVLNCIRQLRKLKTRTSKRILLQQICGCFERDDGTAATEEAIWESTIALNQDDDPHSEYTK